MSHYLWKYLLEDDVEGFRQYLARATYIHGGGKSSSTPSGHTSYKIGSPNSFGTSPKIARQKRAPFSPITATSARDSGYHLTRAAINKRDSLGRTLLHCAATSSSVNALEFVKLLLEVPTLDLYVQDAENGWTALHRALYFGNINVAHALLRKDIQNITDYANTTSLVNPGGLIKIKDHEGNSPFEVYGSTIAPRSLQNSISATLLDAGDHESLDSVDVGDPISDRNRITNPLPARINLHGNEVFSFGSNKNLSLGLGDEDDRQFPERIYLERPQHLLERLHEEYLAGKHKSLDLDEASSATAPYTSVTDVPAMIRNQPILIQDTFMSKMHTAILTTDPIANLFVSGFGMGGRLGTGDESTQFNFVCIKGGGLARKHVSAIALGQDHTIAICSSGEVFTWGSNKYGQLGYALPEISGKDVPMQLIPRQLYGLVKKEQIVGTAASSIHSVIYSATAMYTFGKNEGQLGLVDADARSLDVQEIPRRVGASILASPIKSVTAIDRATAVLMDNKDVIVFTHYAYKRIIFPFEEAPNMFMTQGLITRYNRETNSICKITSGGNTICAISTFGQVFTVEVPRDAVHVPPNVSTTNPHKAKNALPHPTRVWSIGKPHMCAVDAAVGQDGSIILCTNSGSVWRKETRAKIKSMHHRPLDKSGVKDYKFVRIPHLTEVVAVRSNAFGAFIAIRKDNEVMQQQISTVPPSIWNDLFPLLAFRRYGENLAAIEHGSGDQLPHHSSSLTKSPSPALIKDAILTNVEAENDFVRLTSGFEPLSQSSYDMWVSSSISEVRIPVHSFLLKGRSATLRGALNQIEQTYYFEIPDIGSIEYGSDGHIQLCFTGADFLTIVNFVLYLYTESLIDVWHHTSKALNLAPRYRQIRVELMKIAAALELRHLERAARLMIEPKRCMRADLELAYHDPDFWSHADVVIDLADEAEAPAHSSLLCARCPFFEGLFNGRAGGIWMFSRKNSIESGEPARVDLKHIEEKVFSIVLRYIYADTGEDLFDDISTSDLHGFVDLVIDVMSAANELMLDRLAQICQKVLGKYVTTRNICNLLNTVAECSVDNFKEAALEYICLNLEAMSEQHLLDELDEYLLEELNDVVQDNQLSFMPFVRSGRAEAELLELHPELLEEIEKDRKHRIDSMRIPSRNVHNDERPKKKAAQQEEDLPFTMDEEGTSLSPSLRAKRSSTSIRPKLEGHRSSSLALSTSFDTEDTFIATSVDTEPSNVPNTPQQVLLSPPSAPADGFQLPRAVWRTPTSPETRTDFKTIMEQTNTTYASGLTQQMAQASSNRVKSAPRMSQKERKRQIQKLKEQEMEVEPSGSSGSKATTESPWAKIAPTPRHGITSPLSEASSNQVLEVSQISPRPELNLRQRSGVNSHESRDASLNTVGKTSIPTVPPQPQPTAPQIQSIRHIPVSSRMKPAVDAHTSMIDILSQQQGEKIAVKEAIAKRSLQEIQQEQEFQEWWDQESRRVQEEEAKAAALATRQSKSSRGNVKVGKRKASGRGGVASSEHPKEKGLPMSSGEGSVRQSHQGQATSELEQSSGRTTRSRQRGSHHRGGGRRSTKQETTPQPKNNP